MYAMQTGAAPYVAIVYIFPNGCSLSDSRIIQGTWHVLLRTLCKAHLLTIPSKLYLIASMSNINKDGSSSLDNIYI